MSHWKNDTPLEALEHAIATGGLLQGMRARRNCGTPGEVIEHFAKHLPEEHALLCQLRAEDMFTLREDHARKLIEPRWDGMEELWRQWNEQVRPGRAASCAAPAGRVRRRAPSP